mgnify:CR=1 FL=1
MTDTKADLSQLAQLEALFKALADATRLHASCAC